MSLLTDLNDPYEFFEQSISKEALDKYKKELKHGIICLSGTFDCPLMWGHYADSHKGVCLGFDVDEDLLLKVEYVDNPLCLNLNKNQNLTEDNARSIISTKSNLWKYEKEYRFFVNLPEKPQISQFYYASFSEKLLLREIILGANCLDAKNLAECVAKANYGYDIKIHKAKLSNTSFKIDIQ